MSQIPRDLLARAFPNMPRLWAAFEDQADKVYVEHDARISDTETKLGEVDGAVAAVTSGRVQPANPLLDAISALPDTPGAIEQVATGVIGVRPIDAADTHSLLSRAIADTRYALGRVTPATSTSPGAPGQYSWDANHLYICVASNTWMRVTVATF